MILFDEVTVRRTEFNNHDSFPGVSPDTEYISLTMNHIIISGQFNINDERFCKPERATGTVGTTKSLINPPYSLYSLQGSPRTSRLGALLYNPKFGVHLVLIRQT